MTLAIGLFRSEFVENNLWKPALRVVGGAAIALALVLGGMATSAQSATPSAAASTEPSMSLGPTHACAVASGGEAYCWGEDINGQYGSGFEPARPPERVAGMPRAIALSSQRPGGCVIDEARELWCWGQSQAEIGNEHGRSGFVVPTRIEGMPGVEQIDTWRPRGEVCALLASGALRCFFYTYNEPPTPHLSTQILLAEGRIAGLSDVNQIASGYYNYCARLNVGLVRCWGLNNLLGQLGYEGAAPDDGVSVEVPGVRPATSVTMNGSAACALLATGHVQCWGDSYAGLLGTFDTRAIAPPSFVRGPNGAQALNLWTSTPTAATLAAIHARLDALERDFPAQLPPTGAQRGTQHGLLLRHYPATQTTLGVNVGAPNPRLVYVGPLSGGVLVDAGSALSSAREANPTRE